ncbi:MAG: hypothetical protein IKG46_00525 [Solobacterium sp.]|nr:hypothetical protein [Solobacterium sp.]
MIGKLAWVGCGFLFGTVGTRILGSDDAKKLYTSVTAAVMRGYDDAAECFTAFKENCEDIAADAKEINRKRYEEKETKRIEDAKAVLKQAEESEA